MNALLHRHCAKFIYVLPDGLRELMSDISREVLRSHPKQMYTFIADYLDALMITRENARVAARLVECITEIGVTIVELLTKTGITREDANKAAVIIQIAFRKHLEHKREFQLKQLNLSKEEEEEYFTNQIIQQCGISYEKVDEAIRIIQEAYRRFRQHEKVEHDLLLGMIDWRVAARSAIYLYRKTGVSIYEANRAATLIKAAYKGYYTRQVMRRLVEEGHQAFDMEMVEVAGSMTDMGVVEVEGSMTDMGEESEVTKTVTDDLLTANLNDPDVTQEFLDNLLDYYALDEQSFEGTDEEGNQELLNNPLLTSDDNEEMAFADEIEEFHEEAVEDAPDSVYNVQIEDDKRTSIIAEEMDFGDDKEHVIEELHEEAVEDAPDTVYNVQIEDDKRTSIIAEGTDTETTENIGFTETTEEGPTTEETTEETTE